jgi:hypothetical protein
MPSTISFTEISTYKTCRLKHHWRYDRNLEPNRYEPRLTMGTLCHAGIESALRNQGDVAAGVNRAYIDFCSGRDLFDEEKEELLKQTELATDVVCRYMNETSLPGRPIVVEHPFELRIPGTRNKIAGRFDAILRSPDGVWLAEWKFPTRFRTEEDIQLSTQLAIYQWAAIRCGYPVVGILYNQILPKLPAIPNQNKNGTTSRKEIMTDWETYARTVAERGDIPANYEEEMRPKLANKEFSKTYRIYRSPEQVEHYVRELVDVSRDIANPKRRLYACESSISCGACAYREICLEKARGRDEEQIIASAYRNRNSVEDHAEETTLPEFDL